MTDIPSQMRQLRSLVTADGELQLTIEMVPTPTPGPGEVLVRMEAAPINPSDLGLLIATADVSKAKRDGAVVFRNVHIEARSPALNEAIRQQSKMVQSRYESPSAIRALPEVASFQEILRQVGVNQRRDQPSVERLLGYAFKRGDLPAV